MTSGEMQTGDTTSQQLARSIRRHIWGGGQALIVLLAFLLAWSYLTRISGAVVASGSLVVESNIKTVKHKEGGVVAEIAVRNGDRVSAGELLLRLQSVAVRASLEVVQRQLNRLSAMRGRLVAERDGLDQVSQPKLFRPVAYTEPDSSLQSEQEQMMLARKAALASRLQQLHEQIRQFDIQIDGFVIQSKAKRKEMALIELELPGLEQLLQKSLVSASRVYGLRRDLTRLEAEIGALKTEAARASTAKSEKHSQIFQLQQEHRADVMRQIFEVDSQVARLQEQEIALTDQLKRTEIRAPTGGYVHQLGIHTAGGYISSAEPLMLIVPEGDALIVEAQVNPSDVDQVLAGQAAIIRLTGLDRNRTPELTAYVKSVSAETIEDQSSGLRYYSVRLALPEEESSKIPDVQLLPGMPVEVLMETSKRSILSYLIKPITDQLARALNEH